LLPGEDFDSEAGAAAGKKGKAEASKTDLSKGAIRVEPIAARRYE